MEQQPNEPMGSLEARGIAVETQIDQNILSPGTAKAVRFRVSKPSGYSSKEVDDFVQNIVLPSIEWYRGTIYQRDKVVHTLGQALDQAEVDVKNLRSQIQFIEYNNSIKQGIGRNEDDKEAQALMERLALAEEEAANLRAAGAGGIDPETQAYIQQITKQYEALALQYELETNDLQAQLAVALAAAASAVVGSTPEQDAEVAERIEELQAQNLQLSENYQTDVQALENKLKEALLEVAALKAAPIAPAVDEETQTYILQLTEQYNTLAAQYETDVAALQSSLDAALLAASASGSAPDDDRAQLEEYVETVTAQYNTLIQRYEEDTAALQAQLDEALKNSLTAPAVSGEMDAETQEYVKTVTAQYNELLRRYEVDVAALQAELDAKNSNESSDNSAEIQALEKYITDLTAQYVELVARYEQDVSDSPSESELKLSAENAELKARIAELEVKALGNSDSDSDSEEEAEKARTLLATEDKQRSIDSTKYGNLPPGIRPDDLE